MSPRKSEVALQESTSIQGHTRKNNVDSLKHRCIGCCGGGGCGCCGAAAEGGTGGGGARARGGGAGRLPGLPAAAVGRLLREALEAEAPGHAEEVLAGFRGSLRKLGAAKGQATADYTSNAAAAAWKRAAAGRGAATQHPEAFDLAAAVLKRLLCEDAASEEPVLEHATVHAGGALHFFTRRWVRQQRALGRVLCRGCGFFLAEGGPMRQHAQGAGGSRCLDLAAAEYYEKPAGASESALAAAAFVGQEPVELSAVRNDLDAGMEAARAGQLEVLQGLTLSGQWQPLTACDRRGNGPLHWAAGAGHLSVCRWLVEEAGVDPTKPTTKHAGRTALHWAARNGHSAVCRWLLGRCTRADCETDGGDTPLMLAAWQGRLEVCRLLASLRADVGHRNSWGCTAMHKAARMDGAASSLEVLQFLYEQGLDPCAANCNGHNALHKAAMHGSAPAARWLLEHAGCRSRAAAAPDRDRNSPSALAWAAGFRELAAELRHVEDVLWLVPAVYHPAKPADGQAEAGRACSAQERHRAEAEGGPLVEPQPAR